MNEIFILAGRGGPFEGLTDDNLPGDWTVKKVQQVVFKDIKVILGTLSLMLNPETIRFRYDGRNVDVLTQMMTHAFSRIQLSRKPKVKVFSQFKSPEDALTHLAADIIHPQRKRDQRALTLDMTQFDDTPMEPTDLFSIFGGLNQEGQTLSVPSFIPPDLLKGEQEDKNLTRQGHVVWRGLPSGVEIQFEATRTEHLLSSAQTLVVLPWSKLSMEEFHIVYRALNMDCIEQIIIYLTEVPLRHMTQLPYLIALLLANLGVRKSIEVRYFSSEQDKIVRKPIQMF